MAGNVSMIPGDVTSGAPPIMGGGGGTRPMGSVAPSGGGTPDMYQTMMVAKMIADMAKKNSAGDASGGGGGLGGMFGSKGGAGTNPGPSGGGVSPADAMVGP